MLTSVYNFIFYQVIALLKEMVVSNPVGHLKLVSNKKPHPAENKQYFYVKVLVNNEPVSLLMTLDEYQTLLNRAENNKEDFK